MCKVFPSFALEAKITAYVLPSVSTTCAVLLPRSAKRRGGKRKINYPPTARELPHCKRAVRARIGVLGPGPASMSVFSLSPSWFFLLLRLIWKPGGAHRSWPGGGMGTPTQEALGMVTAGS